MARTPISRLILAYFAVCASLIVAPFLMVAGACWFGLPLVPSVANACGATGGWTALKAFFYIFPIGLGLAAIGAVGMLFFAMTKPKTDTNGK